MKTPTRLTPPRPEDFASPLHDARVATRIGTWLGACFTVAFLTGLVSHWAQLSDPALSFPTRPVWGYRLTQGLHIASGVAAVPLLLIKLWTVYPHLFARPAGRRAEVLLRTALERLSVAVLVAAALFELTTGLINVTGWYPWSFSFRPAHFTVAWVAVGALAVHVAVKLPTARANWHDEAGRADRRSPEMSPTSEPTRSRRDILTWAGIAALLAVVSTATSGVPGLRRMAVLAPRSGEGPQGVPINRSARAAGVVAQATTPAYRLTIVDGDREVSLTVEGLLALPRRVEDLPLACVEGWSVGATWGGVRVRDLLDMVGAAPGRDVRVVSLQQRGAFGISTLPAAFADDPLTLLATHLNGDRLSLDHGFPCRVIAPNRPGVLQTKWVTRLEVLA